MKNLVNSGLRLVAPWMRLPVLGFEVGRSAQFKLEGQLLYALERLLPGIESVDHPDRETTKTAGKLLFTLLSADAERISRGVYPVSVLMPEHWREHLKRLPKIILDGYRIGRKRKTGRTTEFSAEIEARLESLPRYYRRTFHFQTDGYLSQMSAELYEHEVELLFAGSADPMRRLGIEPLKQALQTTDGKGTKILEIACGTGRATGFLAASFPRAHITANDLSGPYLQFARRRLGAFENIDFIQGRAEQLPFLDEQFDAVTSVFLFHELPEDVRVDVLREALRVLRPGGVLSYVDSIQKGDVPELDAGLAQFPVSYHEPYYRNYVETPMWDLVQRAAKLAGVTVERVGDTGIGFTSRTELFQKK